MELWRIVSEGSCASGQDRNGGGDVGASVNSGLDAAGVDGGGTDVAGEAAAGKAGRAGVGDGRGDEFPRAKFGTQLFYVKGRGISGELRVVPQRGAGKPRAAAGRAEGGVAGRPDGVRTARATSTAGDRGGIAGRGGVATGV